MTAAHDPTPQPDPAARQRVPVRRGSDVSGDAAASPLEASDEWTPSALEVAFGTAVAVGLVLVVALGVWAILEAGVL